MTIKNEIIALVNVVYRKDPFINDFTEAISKVFNNISLICDSIKDNCFFDSLDENGAMWWEKHLQIVPTDNDLIYRRAKIQAKWNASRHNDVKLIQSICDAWRNGQVKVDFYRAIRKGEIDGILTKGEMESYKNERFANDGIIRIEFVSEYGIPPDLEDLKAMVDDFKPAHIIVSWVYNFLLKKNIDNVMTKGEMESTKKNLFCYIE